MDIRDRQEKLRLNFMDDFEQHFGRKDAYRMRSEFKCERAPQLQDFLFKDYDGRIKPYIVWDSRFKMIVGYFTLITSCMIYSAHDESDPNHLQEKDVDKIIPCIELEHFAINDVYLDNLEKRKYNNKGVGRYIFERFISDIMVILYSQINFRFLILHAINHPKVIDAYRKMGFETFEDDAENIIPALSDVIALHYNYAGDCKFMFQDIEMILNNVDGR